MQEGTMTAHNSRKGKAVARQVAKTTPEPTAEHWPEVVRYALESWSRTARLCVLVIVIGALLLLAVRLGLRFWV
jgi:hypothetical protein